MGWGTYAAHGALTRMKLKLFILETRPQFLVLSVILAFVGSALAWNQGVFRLGYALLAGFGLVLAHIAVNVLNDVFDYRSGIDLATRRTPFSGGSGMLPQRLLTPRQALGLGIGSLALAAPIGVFFVYLRGLGLAPILVLAVLFIVLYSPVILKYPWPEWSAGVGLGALPVLGMVFVQTGSYDGPAIAAAVPPALLVHNLLLLNEFPDIEADRGAGRRTLPITLGPRGAARVFAGAAVAVYVWIAAAVAAGVFPAWTLLALGTIPLTFRAIRGAFQSGDPDALLRGMAANVGTVLLTQLLLGAGFILDRLVP